MLVEARPSTSEAELSQEELQSRAPQIIHTLITTLKSRLITNPTVFFSEDPRRRNTIPEHTIRTTMFKKEENDWYKVQLELDECAKSAHLTNFEIQHRRKGANKPEERVSVSSRDNKYTITYQNGSSPHTNTTQTLKEVEQFISSLDTV